MPLGLFYASFFLEVKFIHFECFTGFKFCRVVFTFAKTHLNIKQNQNLSRPF